MNGNRAGQSARVDHSSEPSLICAEVSSPRLFFVDNLRWTMIFLVISMHAADTYSPFGNWYFQDRAPLTPAELLTFAVWQMYLQAFFMGLLFFLAGSFVPGSFARKGPYGFVRERSFRLGLPVLFYMFVLGPITEYFVAHSWNSTTPTSFTKEWLKHIRNGQFLQENGPLWFCLALLIFSIAYAAGKVFLGLDRTNRELSGPTTRGLVVFALAMSAGRFLLRALLPADASILNMHLGDFAQYVLMFSAGVAAARCGWLRSLSGNLSIRTVLLVLPLGLAAWLFLVRDVVSGKQWKAMEGGWHWQSAAFSLWESFSCVGICLGLLVIFRRKWNTQGRLQKFLSDNAFAVYVFHPPIVVFIARMMSGLRWSPLLKALALTGFAAFGSFTLSAAVFRRVPLLRRVI